MSEEETKIEAITEEPKAEVSTDVSTPTPSPKKKGKKWPVVVGVVVVVLIAAGAGFWVWHEQPSFCNAICHTPMDPYVETYDQTLGQPGIDKWGNEVSNTHAMLAVVHKEEGKDCLACHVPTLGEQVSEGMNWVTGNYINPLEERDLEQLTEARGAKNPEEFCLNESCHNMTRAELTEVLADKYPKRNPHQAQHGEIDCNECHKAHRASVNYCSQCHSDAPIPDGWLTTAQASKLSQS